jgi:ferritin-like metal-binding protein YciE
MSTQMSDPRELFLHELGDVLYAERVLVKTLPTLQEEASDEELAFGFEQHLKQTREHVKNLETAFEKLGETPKAEKCPGIEGIKQEHDDFVAKESPSQDVLDSFLTGAGARTEHYEIAAYEGLVTMAEAMGEAEVVDLLSENLEQEKTALEKQARRRGRGPPGHVNVRNHRRLDRRDFKPCSVARLAGLDVTALEPRDA